jgi:phosphohistidine phosphatase SixA
MLLLVRHAEAGDKRRWDGPDLLRPLSPTGRSQATGLVERLQDYPIERILSSPAVRCQQTVQPLARDRHLPIESSPTLGADGSPAEVLALFWDQRLSETVLCGHGETIAWLLDHLAANGLVSDAPLQAAKGSTWLLERTNSQVHAHYLPPPALDHPSLPAPSRRGRPGWIPAWQEAQMARRHRA